MSNLKEIKGCWIFQSRPLHMLDVQSMVYHNAKDAKNQQKQNLGIFDLPGVLDSNSQNPLLTWPLARDSGIYGPEHLVGYKSLSTSAWEEGHRIIE